MKHLMKAAYPASAEVVLKMFTDPDFHTRKLEAMGLSKYRVLDSSDDGNRFRIKIERKVPVQLVGKSIDSTVAHEERWDRKAQTGEVLVETRGIPLSMSCKAQIRAQDGGSCLIEYQWTVDSSLPLVGGKLEKITVADIDKRAETERQAAIRLLDSYRV